MPELPEVETVRRELEEHIRKKKISDIKVRYPGIIRNQTDTFRRGLLNKQFTAVRRIGKLLQFELSSGKYVLAHLKMTGQFLYQEQGSIQAGIYRLLYASTSGGEKAVARFRERHQQEGLQVKHTHVIMSFEDGSELAFRDQRKFGYLELVNKAKLIEVESRYGIDPLRDEFTVENLMEQFESRSKSVKAVLMDQQLIAGIGNIYADEICHQVGIRPQRSVKRLSKKKKEAIYYAISDIINAAVQKKGTTFRDFARSDGTEGNFRHELQVYGRTGEACNTCESGTIEKTIYLGRGTHYCKQCQK